jgi:hypothetical protein
MSLTPRIDKLNADKNFLHNGALRFWQRGTSLALTGGVTFLADRFGSFANMTGVVGTQSRSTDVPTYAQSNSNFVYSHQMLVTTGAAATGNEASLTLQRMEGLNYQSLHGAKEVSFQFWVKAAKTGTMSVQFSNSGGSRGYVSTVNIDAANTWEAKVINFSTDDTGTWLFDNGIGLNMGFMFAAAGTRLTSTINQWHVPPTTAFIAANTQTNFLSSNNDYVRITGVQLLLGNYDEYVPYSFMNPAAELSMLQRYYEKSYNVDTAPASVTSLGMVRAVQVADSVSSTTGSSLSFKANKRSAPTITFYNQNGTSDSWEGFSPSDANINPDPQHIGDSGFVVNIASGYTLVVDDACVVSGHWTAESEL